MTGTYRSLFLLFLLGLGPGCSQTRSLAPGTEAADLLLRNLEAASTQRPVRLRLRDGRSYAALNLVLATDSTSWIDVRSGLRHVLPTPHLLRIQRLHRGQGALEGTAIGALAGVAATVALLAAGNDERSDIGPVLLIPGGGLLGFLAGWTSGARQQYDLVAPPPRPAPPVALQPPLAPDSAASTLQRPPALVKEDAGAIDLFALSDPAVPQIAWHSAAPSERPVQETGSIVVPDTLGPALVEGWTVVVGSLDQRGVAQARAQHTREQLPAYRVAVVEGEAGGVRRFRVAVGAWQQLSEAQTALRQLRQTHPETVPADAWLLRVPSSPRKSF